MTKEKIISEYQAMGEYPTYYHESCIELMMDEYAEQEAIEFAEWIDEQVYNNNLSRVRARNSIHFSKWAYAKGVPNPQFFTTAELFQLVKQSKSVR